MQKLYFAAVLVLFVAQAQAQTDFERQIQTQLILAEPGDVITIPAGRYQISGTLSVDDKQGITIRGAGEQQTILSFKGQVQGAEGIKITNSRNITIEQLTVEDSKGDLIKTQQVHGLTFRHVTARWSGKPKASNGSYALYPVQCSRVMIEYCTAIGASDAGIYVGQSDSVWVHHCVANRNVAGIEIENTTHAWVYENEAIGNTGGILVFDLPDLPVKQGGYTEVHHNRIESNNYRNFAPKGNIVGKVPPGTGVMILAANNVHVHDNQILRNKTVGTAIVSYYIAETPIQDTAYNPYPFAIKVENNTFSRKRSLPTWRNKMGILFTLKFGRRTPRILYDGIENPAWLDSNGQRHAHRRICIGSNVHGSFANLRADKGFKGISRDTTNYRCE
jgi:parallel beta-helix repeat protein